MTRGNLWSPVNTGHREYLTSVNLQLSYSNILKMQVIFFDVEYFWVDIATFYMQNLRRMEVSMQVLQAELDMENIVRRHLAS